MSELIRVAKPFLGYAKRSDLYPELDRNIFRRKCAFSGKEKTNLWAFLIAVRQENVIKDLFQIPFQKFSERLPEEIQNNYPLKMRGIRFSYGWDSFTKLLSLKKRNGTLYSSDMQCLGQGGDQFASCIVPEKLKKNWKLFRHADRESLPKILKETKEIDVVHYDSDKSYEGMKWAYETLFSRLRKGGVFISDDINDNSASQDFCKGKNISPTVVDFKGKFVGLFIK